MIHTRDEFPVLRHTVWLMNNARGPMPLRVAAALREAQAMLGDDPLGAVIEFERAAERSRELAAAMLRARPSEIAFFGNTSECITAVAQALTFAPGDNVVLPGGEFPGLVYPWRGLARRGLELRFVPLDDPSRRLAVEQIAATVDERTRAVALSHVDWISGARRDLEAIGRFCRERDILFIVDASQSMGVLPIDVDEAAISALACRGDKWLLASGGIALLYVREDLQEQLAPGLLGYYGMDFDEGAAAERGFSYPIQLRAGAGRYELGVPNEPGLIALSVALEWLLELGIENISAHALGLARQIGAGVAARGYQLLTPQGEGSSIAAFVAPDFELVQERLWENGIVVGGDEALRLVQASPHFFNSEADVRHLLNSLPPL